MKISQEWLPEGVSASDTTTAANKALNVYALSMEKRGYTVDDAPGSRDGEAEVSVMRKKSQMHKDVLKNLGENKKFYDEPNLTILDTGKSYALTLTREFLDLDFHRLSDEMIEDMAAVDHLKLQSKLEVLEKD
ncbi:MAG: hypothetical protein EOP06_00845 [Proteobacteria bacterium]|nr:MAG: hypothetical protein EOP06_00845 [Pseudomonadota bacterium]